MENAWLTKILKFDWNYKTFGKSEAKILFSYYQ